MQKSASQVILSGNQLTLHATRRTPHVASRLVHAMSSWSMKTRCAPSRCCRDARVNGHMTTVMHKMTMLKPYLIKWSPEVQFFETLRPFHVCDRMVKALSKTKHARTQDGISVTRSSLSTFFFVCVYYRRALRSNLSPTVQQILGSLRAPNRRSSINF